MASKPYDQSGLDVRPRCALYMLLDFRAADCSRAKKLCGLRLRNDDRTSLNLFAKQIRHVHLLSYYFCIVLLK